MTQKIAVVIEPLVIDKFEQCQGSTYVITVIDRVFTVRLLTYVHWFGTSADLHNLYQAALIWRTFLMYIRYSCIAEYPIDACRTELMTLLGVHASAAFPNPLDFALVEKVNTVPSGLFTVRLPYAVKSMT